MKMLSKILYIPENLGGDLGFMIQGVFKYELFGHEVWITTSHICLLLVDIVLIAFFIMGGLVFKRGKDVPGPLQALLEFIVEFTDNLVDNAMGPMGKIYRNYIGTIFIFILFSNISGLLGLRPPTADYAVTLPMALTTFILVRFNEVKYTDLWSLWKDKCSPLPWWCPIWLPINIIGDCAVPVSLSLRLFANVLSGTIMMSLVYGLLGSIKFIIAGNPAISIATGWPAALHVYFDLFSGAIQTYVFCMLTVTYIGSAIGDNDMNVIQKLIAKRKAKKAAKAAA